MDVLRFFLNKLQRDLERGVVEEQIIKRLRGYNFAPGTACPTFSLGQIDSGQIAAAGTLIKDLVAGKVIGPEEPWIREYLGRPVWEARRPLPATSGDPPLLREGEERQVYWARQAQEGAARRADTGVCPYGEGAGQGAASFCFRPVL